MSTPPAPDSKTRALDLLEAFGPRLDRIETQIATTLESLAILADLIHAQQLAQPAQAQAQPAGAHVPGETFIMSEIVMTLDDNGKPAFKGKGERFQKFGIRIWPEVLPRLHVDAAHLKPGPNAINPLAVTFELTEDGKPRKITGPAIYPAPPSGLEPTGEDIPF